MPPPPLHGRRIFFGRCQGGYHRTNTYSLNNWQALCEYARHGNLAIDNNAAERKLRPVAVGRKNYLFFGSDNGGHTAAALYSVIVSAKRHGLDPWRYLRDVFARLPSMTVSQLHELLPDKWRDSH